MSGLLRRRVTGRLGTVVALDWDSTTGKTAVEMDEPFRHPSVQGHCPSRRLYFYWWELESERPP
jgi:hypothetical protein